MEETKTIKGKAKVTQVNPKTVIGRAKITTGKNSYDKFSKVKFSKKNNKIETGYREATDAEILKEAMRKASEKGYKSILSVILESFDLSDVFIAHGDYIQYIFSKDFAKALWGEEIKPKSDLAPEFDGDFREVHVWEFHLQQMVLEDSYLKYIEKFL